MPVQPLPDDVQSYTHDFLDEQQHNIHGTTSLQYPNSEPAASGVLHTSTRSPPSDTLSALLPWISRYLALICSWSKRSMVKQCPHVKGHGLSTGCRTMISDPALLSTRNACLATTDCTCQIQHNNVQFSKMTAVLGPAHGAVNWQVEDSSRCTCELVSKV